MTRLLATLAVLWLLGTGAAAEPDARFEGGAVRDTDQNGAEIALTLSSGVPWRVFTLEAPDRVVIDLRGLDWQGARPQALLQGRRVGPLRLGAFAPGWARLVARLPGPMAVESAAMRVDPADGRARLRVALRQATRSEASRRAGAPQDPRWDPPRVSQENAPPPADGVLRVMLDPGHGGLDPGAEAEGQTEAALMLVFARELAEVLRESGHEVRLTREADVFVSLQHRIARAHDAGADLFVSLHADALVEGEARGATVYMLSDAASDAASAALAERHDRDDLLGGIDLSRSDDRVASVLMDLARLDTTPRSRALARHLADGIRNAVGQMHKRPLRQAGFSVLRAADIPSVLVELGFLSTEADLDNLLDPDWRARMARGIAAGIGAWAEEDEALARLRRR